MQQRTVMMPASITVWNRGMRGDVTPDLHPVVQHIEPIRAAIAKRELEVVKESPKPDAAKGEESPPQLKSPAIAPQESSPTRPSTQPGKRNRKGS